MFKVHYMKLAQLSELAQDDPDSLALQTFMAGFEVPDQKEFERLYTELMEIEAEKLDDVFCTMQGENWSPNGEARKLVETKGVGHTSMMVGDVAECAKSGKKWICANVGWTQLPY